MKIKLKALALGLVVLSMEAAAVPYQVEHAPTVDQCQADQRLWLSKVENDNRAKDEGIMTLHKWASEMGDCSTVDPANAVKYYNTAAEASIASSMRETDFLIRHNLIDQFYKEDDEGLR